MRPLFPHETEKGGTTVVQVNSNTTIKARGGGARVAGRGPGTWSLSGMRVVGVHPQVVLQQCGADFGSTAGTAGRSGACWGRGRRACTGCA